MCSRDRGDLPWIGLGLALLAASGCNSLDRRNSLKFQSEIGAKIPRATSLVRSSPMLEELDEELVSELRAQLEVTGRAPMPISPALSLGGEEVTDLQFRGAQLGDVIASLAEIADANIVFDPGLTQPIFASFPSIRVGQALHAILDENDLELIENPPGVYVVRDTLLSGGRSRNFSLACRQAFKFSHCSKRIVDFWISWRACSAVPPIWRRI